jgi:hypothetical protein
MIIEPARMREKGGAFVEGVKVRPDISLFEINRDEILSLEDSGGKSGARPNWYVELLR